MLHPTKRILSTQYSGFGIIPSLLVPSEILSRSGEPASWVVCSPSISPQTAVSDNNWASGWGVRHLIVLLHPKTWARRGVGAPPPHQVYSTSAPAVECPNGLLLYITVFVMERIREVKVQYECIAPSPYSIYSTWSREL